MRTSKGPWCLQMTLWSVARVESRWRTAWRDGGVHWRSKADYMCVNERETGGKVNMQVIDVVKVDEFEYIRLTIQRNRQCKGKVKRKLQTGWSRCWRWRCHAGGKDHRGFMDVAKEGGYADSWWSAERGIRRSLEDVAFSWCVFHRIFWWQPVCTLGVTLMQLNVLMFECDHLVRGSGNSNHGPNCGAASVCPLVC